MSRKREVLELRAIIKAIGERNVGHTTLMKYGTLHYDREFVVIGQTQEYAKQLLIGSKKDLGKAFSIENLRSMDAVDLPIAIDHNAMTCKLKKTAEILESCYDGQEVREITVPLLQLAETYQEHLIELNKMISDYLKCVYPWDYFRKIRIKRELIEKMMASLIDKKLDFIFQELKMKLKI